MLYFTNWVAPGQQPMRVSGSAVQVVPILVLRSFLMDVDVRMNGSETPGRLRQRAPSRAKRPRSAVTSGRQLFIDGDPRSAWSRRFHDLVLGHVSDLGGADLLSEAQFSLIRRAAAIECELERLDARLSVGELVDMDSYGRCASHLRRLFETLGVERKSRDVTPTLSDLLREDHMRHEVGHGG
jgi:hypothetical protein